MSNRWWKLEPKVNAVARAAIEMAAPNTVTRTGVAVRPRPGCRASRTPVVPAGDRPAWARPSATRDGRDAPWGSAIPSMSPRTVAAFHDGMAARSATTSARAAPPPSRTSVSKLSPGWGSAILASRPNGVSEDAPKAMTTPRAAPETATI